MPGLAGVIDLRQRVNAPKLLRRLVKRMTHQDWYRIDTSTSSGGLAAFSRVSLGIMNPEPQPITNRDGTKSILMDGEIYAPSSLKKELESEGCHFRIGNDPELLLTLLEKRGEHYLRNMNGAFSIAIWDERTCTLKLINDRYGLRPLYYAEHGGRFVFASEVKAILEDDKTNRKIDEVAV
ncbi:MAG: hypothetical protein ACFFCW_22385, partial [Candidatus Hodarchaeota archaeon]